MMSSRSGTAVHRHDVSSDKQKFPVVRMRGFGEPNRSEPELPPMPEPPPPPEPTVEAPIEVEAPPHQSSPKKQRRSRKRTRVAEVVEPEPEPEEPLTVEVAEVKQPVSAEVTRRTRQTYPSDPDPIRKSRRQSWKDQIYHKVYPTQ